MRDTKEYKMIKIQFDTVTGVSRVEDFDDDVDMIKAEFVFDALKEDFDGVLGAEVDQETFDRINSEYHVN